MIRAESLRKVFHTPRGEPIEAVRGASLVVNPGEIYGLLGPNGAGKTTLLRMLGTIIPPTSGRCWVNDRASDADPQAVRRQIGFLSGNTRLYGRLTPRELLRYFGKLYGLDRAAIDDRTGTVAEMFDMAAFMDRRCDTLSTGQTQKVSIARVILHDPAVLILDEPTLGLDIMTSRSILDFVSDARERGHSIIFSTHYMTEAELLCDRIGLMHRGEILDEGTKENLYAKTGADNLKDAFLGIVDGLAEAGP